MIPLSGQSRSADRTGEEQVLWIKLPDGGEPLAWLKKLMSMFPGESTAIVYLADQRKKLQTRCVLHEALLAELRETLGVAWRLMPELSSTTSSATCSLP